MVNDDIRDDLTAAERTFEESPVTIEDGLDVDDPELVQLRRACRLLAAGSYLLDRGYDTVVIEFLENAPRFRDPGTLRVP